MSKRKPFKSIVFHLNYPDGTTLKKRTYDADTVDKYFDETEKALAEAEKLYTEIIDELEERFLKPREPNQNQH